MKMDDVGKQSNRQAILSFSANVGSFTSKCMELEVDLQSLEYWKIGRYINELGTTVNHCFRLIKKAFIRKNDRKLRVIFCRKVWKPNVGQNFG